MFVSPTNLHCSQTTTETAMQWEMFVSPTNLHCSQTYSMHWISRHLVCFPYEFTLLSNRSCIIDHCTEFVSPTNLHCSQTIRETSLFPLSLFPLRIYTALKHGSCLFFTRSSLFPLRIYTALKRRESIPPINQSLFPLRIYTALKQ